MGTGAEETEAVRLGKTLDWMDVLGRLGVDKRKQTTIKSCKLNTGSLFEECPGLKKTTLVFSFCFALF